MDRERARFVLSCFRPDGADAGDADFAAALHLAAADRELGAWLAQERAQDAQFAAALAQVDIPPDMRERILAGLAAVRQELPTADDPLDRAFVGALASWTAPATLRAKILTAMERTAASRRTLRWNAWLGLPLAAAAGVALAWLLWPKAKTSQPPPVAHTPLTADAVEAGFFHAFDSPGFTLDMKRPEHQAIFDHIHAHSLPCPGGFPPGLEDVPGIGCRELLIDGHRGTLICFERCEAGVVHLLVFDREDVCDRLPCHQHPDFERHGRWAVAHWADAKHAFFLIGETETDKLASLF
jgi:hypothetical protein